MQSLDLSDLKNKKVILRVDFNVPIDEKGNVEDDTRIIAAKPSLDYLLRNQNKVILISYLGRPDKKDPKFSLKPIIGRLSELYPHHEIVFIEDFLEDDSRVLSQTDKQIILFENIRFYPQEQKNDETYIKKIAHYADAYVNDAFSVSHRKESTVTGLPRFLPSYAGFQLEKEVSMLKKALGGKGSPRVTVLGGAKVSTKIHLIEKFITSSTYILLGGALANTFLATQGVSMGESLYENEFSNIALELLKKAQHEGCVILLPEDFIRGDGNAIVDIGPKTIEGFEKTIKKAHTIIWNGPMGLYEDPRYRAGSDKIFSAIAANHSALSIIGGGDTLLVLENKSEEEKSHISHISIGGGAMLEFIENGTLPGIEALDR